MRIMALLMATIWSTTALAAHSYGGMDLCTTYPEKMPPGIIDAAQLPYSSSAGVELMQNYCEQCHYLPGPGRHTASEWPALLKKMNLLMDVSNRFGNLMGKVLTPTESEREIMQEYLINNALIPMEPIPEEIKGQPYERHCGNCHALPDPKQHTAAQWPQVIQRMLRSMAVMKYSPPSDAELNAIERYLQNSEEGDSAVNISGTATAPSAEDRPMMGTLFALGPFLLLALIGVVRWYFNHKKRGAL